MDPFSLHLEWINDPTALLGLLTLVLLEIVLGIDNLIFIAILADKLPPQERDRARIIGLSLALVLRLLLLASISWLVKLTDPLFTVFGQEISERDLIFLAGGLFLLFKATMELHERLEINGHQRAGPRMYAGFWAVITQIVVLDAVFSIDSVITAVGMVEELTIMMTAVVVAILIMMAASKPLTAFVNAHPTVIVLCLGFLMMIGLSLIADGVGVHIPKGYLYAAIGFSVLVEGFNQFARAKRKKAFAGKLTLRERTAEAVLRLLGGQAESEQVGDEIAEMVGDTDTQPVFQRSETVMIRGVLALTEKSVKSVMTSRVEVEWIDLSDDEKTIIQEIRATSYSRLIVVQDGNIGEPLGIVQKKDLLDMLLDGAPLDIPRAVRQPLFVPESLTVLEVMDRFKKEAHAPIAFVVDEFGGFEGIVTLTDVMAVIAGGLADEEMEAPSVVTRAKGVYEVDGRTDLHDLQEILGDELDISGDYHTAAGIALQAFGRIPKTKETAVVGPWQITVAAMDGNRIASLVFTRLMPEEDGH